MAFMLAQDEPTMVCSGTMERTMTDEERRELCQNLRALSPGYSKMDGSYVEIGLEAADEIERLAREHYTRRQLRTKFEEWAFTRGDRNFTKSGGGYLLPEIQMAWLAFRAGAAAIEKSDDDRPLGFRTWDVPHPYAEGPQSDTEPPNE